MEADSYDGSSSTPAQKTQSISCITWGVAMPVADELLPTRVYGYQWTERNNISGKTSTLEKGEGALAHINIQIKDLLTGATIYGIYMKKTNPTCCSISTC